MNEAQHYTVIKAPHISEKSSFASMKFRQYVFRVMQDATKPMVKAAVEKLFNVKVKSVRIVNVKPRRVTFGRTLGKQKAWKKAYVSLAEGFTIETGTNA